MKIKFLKLPYYLGISAIILSLLFRIQHWFGAHLLSLVGIALEILFALLIIIEMSTSKKVEKETKIIWIIYYTFFPLLVFLFARGLLLILLVLTIGAIYFRQTRKYFIGNKTVDIEFDSI